MFNFHKTKKCFFILIVLLLKKTYGMLELKDQQDWFSNIPQEIFFLITDCGLSKIAKETPFKTKHINYIHKTNGHEDQYEKIIKYIQSLNQTSKKFSNFIHQYREQHLKKYINEKKLFYFAINTNNIRPIDYNFLPIKHNYKKQLVILKWLQWEMLYNSIVSILKMKNHNNNNIYLVKASKNCLQVCLQIMHENIIGDFLKNYTPYTDKKIYTIYGKKVEYHFPHNSTWLDNYLKSKGKDKPKILNPNNSLYVNYTDHEINKLKNFIQKHKNFCLKNKYNIIDFLKKPSSSIKKIYLLIRFLIVFNSLKDEEKNNSIKDTLTTLSNEYWYNQEIFF